MRLFVRPKVLVAATAAFLFAMSSYATRFSVWVPSWDTNALTSMQLHAGLLDETNPGWYSLDATGAEKGMGVSRGLLEPLNDSPFLAFLSAITFATARRLCVPNRVL